MILIKKNQYTTICFVSFVYSVFNEHLRNLAVSGGDDGIRTHDPLLAGQVLSQLSYTPRLFLGFCYFSVLTSFKKFGRPKWTRTTDLVLIRHAL